MDWPKLDWPQSVSSGLWGGEGLTPLPLFSLLPPPPPLLLPFKHPPLFDPSSPLLSPLPPNLSFKPFHFHTLFFFTDNKKIQSRTRQITPTTKTRYVASISTSSADGTGDPRCPTREQATAFAVEHARRQHHLLYHPVLTLPCSNLGEDLDFSQDKKSFVS